MTRSYLVLRRRNDARARAISTILVDRFLGLHSLLFLGAVSTACLIAKGSNGWVLQTVASLTWFPLLALTVSLIAFLCNPSRGILLRFLPASWRWAWDDSFAAYRAAIPELLGCYALSVVGSTMTVASFAVGGRLLGGATSWENSFLAGPLVVVANCLPITPGGVGLAEAVSSQLFSRLGSSAGAEIMVLLRACGLILTLPGIFATQAIVRYGRIPVNVAAADTVERTTCLAKEN